MKSFPIVLTTCVVLASAAAHGQVTQYCPADADIDKVCVVDFQRLRDSSEFANVASGQTLTEFVKQAAFQSFPSARTNWESFPRRSVIESFTDATTKIMLISPRSSLDVAIILEGKFDEDLLASAIRDWARHFKIADFSTNVQPKSTCYTFPGAGSVAIISESAIALGSSNLIDKICAKVSKEDLAVPDNRYVDAVTQQLKKDGVVFASASTDSKLFVAATYDIERCEVIFSDGKVHLTIRRDDLNYTNAKTTESNFKEKIQRLATRLSGKPLAANISHAEVERDDKRVNMRVEASLRTITDSLSALLKATFSEEDGRTTP